MAVPQNAPSGFPDDEGADDFVREFRQVVAPAEREALAYTPPLVILDVQGEDAEYDARVRRVLGELESALRGRRDEKLVPYALPSAAQDSDLLSGAAARGLAFGLPKNMKPDRFPGFWPLWDSVSYIREHAADGTAAPGANVLRDHAHEQLRIHRRQRREGRLQAFLWALGGSAAPPAGGLYGWLLGSVWHGLWRTLPRSRWEHRKTRRMVRSWRPFGQGRERWLGSVLGMPGGTETLFAVMDEVADRQMPRLKLPLDHPRHQESLLAIELLLTRALLEDLKKPAVGGVLPVRRRRTARPVLLVPLPRPGKPGVQAVERFLRAFHQGRDTTAGEPGPLVIAVGRPSGQLLGHLGSPEDSSLRQAGRLIQPQNPSRTGPVLVRLRDEPFTRDGLYIRPSSPTSFRLSGRAVTTGVAGGTTVALAAALLGLGTVDIDRGPSSNLCVGGDLAPGGSAYAQPVALHPKEWYDATRAQIDQQNKQAERYAAEGHTVRTVVAFGSGVPTSATETLFDGTIPELRGIAMWQQQLNERAGFDNTVVPLRVLVRSTGAGFKGAEQSARTLVHEIRTGAFGKDGKDYEKVVGVLGYAQSKSSTRNALKILKEVELPVIGTTATADAMLVSPNYWPFTPLNSTEAQIEADFAGKFPIVARTGADGCERARHAVVIESSGDLYSSSLASSFRKDFARYGSTDLVDFSQEGDFSGAPDGTQRITSSSDLAATVCSLLSSSKPTVVYWSARARDFKAFVEALDTQGTCTHRDVTVLGGNELTNVALTGTFNDKKWLRLYYSAHRLPASDSRADDKTVQFAKEYDTFVSGAADDDPWRDDGHSAVAYDAFHVLSQAADRALSNGDVEPSAMLAALRGEITFGGATGYVSYGPGGGKPPRDKTLVLLRQTGDGPIVAEACGAYQEGQKYQNQGAPCAP